MDNYQIISMRLNSIQSELMRCNETLYPSLLKNISIDIPNIYNQNPNILSLEQDKSIPKQSIESKHNESKNMNRSK